MIAPALLMGAAAFGSSALGSIGNYFKNRDALSFSNRQIDALERQDRLAFQRQNQEYDAYVRAQTEAYEADVENLKRQYEFNARARQNSIETGLTALSDLSDDLVNKAFARNLKLTETIGIKTAAGQTGKSVRRLDNLQRAAAGRGAAQDVGTMERAMGQFMFQEKDARFRQEVANQNAFNQVRRPIFGPRPVAPQSRVRPTDNTGRDLMFGLGNALFSGAQTYFGSLPGDPFGGGGGSAVSNRASLGFSSASVPGIDYGGFGITGGNYTSLFDPKYNEAIGAVNQLGFGMPAFNPF